ncbi:MAG: hypothetical protein U9Q68_03130 [Euryarchaeota archaeon]|nr:hypothetical protein [Euryarchaeota archaeon]
MITIFIHGHAIITITIGDIDRSWVYFVCGVRGFTFQAAPHFIPIIGLQHGSEKVTRT